MASVQGTPKPAGSIISEIGVFRTCSYLFLIKDPKSSLHANFSHFGEMVRQRLFNMVRILQTTALKAIIKEGLERKHHASPTTFGRQSYRKGKLQVRPRVTTLNSNVMNKKWLIGS